MGAILQSMLTTETAQTTDLPTVAKGIGPKLDPTFVCVPVDRSRRPQ
jgi:hypothetical protein